MPDDYFQYLKNALQKKLNEVRTTKSNSAGKVPDDCKILVITALKGRHQRNGKEIESLIILKKVEKFYYY